MRFDPSTYDGVNKLWENRSLRTSNVHFGEVRYKPGGFVGPRVQHNFQLVIIHSGSCTVSVDKIEYDIPVGSASLYVPGHVEHFAFDPGTETHHTWCHINPRFLPAAVKRALLKAPRMATCSETFKHLHASALKIKLPVRSYSAQLLEQIALSIMLEYLNMAGEQANVKDRNAPVNSATRYMEEHYGDTDCLSGALKKSGISQNAMIYKFREALNMTPARYLWKLRGEQGVAMLAETGLSIAEIAYRCGFKNPYHFSRMVKTLQGTSPRTVRRKAWLGKI